MEKKSFVLVNKGMNRELSISKAGESSVFENHNIRIDADVHGTQLSVTNERGTKQITLPNISGELIGWNVLNDHLILFTTESGTDRIYRIDYDSTSDSFSMKVGYGEDTAQGIPLFVGQLRFSDEHPIESIVYFESDEIQKIYWVDGINVFRFLNFMAPYSEVQQWNNTQFDSNRPIDSGAVGSITKDNSGNVRPNGTIQYLLTYFNKHGQESAVAWVSELVYLSPLNSGGPADATNNNRVSITFSNLDTDWDMFRVYSLQRTSLNGELTAFLVLEDSVPSDPDATITVSDDGAHLATEDPSRLLFLGSQAVVANTLAQKDQTLFLGNFKVLGKTRDLSDLEQSINETMFEQSAGRNWKSKCVSFVFSDGSAELPDIPNAVSGGEYPYENQLKYPSSVITTFKGGEKYRFALSFLFESGASTKAYWIGDAVNSHYPVMGTVTSDGITKSVVRRPIARCAIPAEVLAKIEAYNNAHSDDKIISARLLIAEASDADRAVKAQGIVNPTVFNLFDRYNNNLFSMPSWVSRPRRSVLANRHFEVLHKATESSGEIACNYWETEDAPTPYYQILNYDTTNPTYMQDTETGDAYQRLMVIYVGKYTGAVHKYHLQAVVIKGYWSDSSTDWSPMINYSFTAEELAAPSASLQSVIKTPYYEKYIYDTNGGADNVSRFSFKIQGVYGWFSGNGTGNPSRNSAYNKMCDYLRDVAGLEEKYIISRSTAYKIFDSLKNKKTAYYYNAQDAELHRYTSLVSAVNLTAMHTPDLVGRWYSLDLGSSAVTAAGKYAENLKHLMFVDENIITLNSPEIEYGQTSVDAVSGLKFRIVGVAPFSAVTADYTVEASHGSLPGENLRFEQFSSTSVLRGLISWPLWTEYGLYAENDAEEDIEERKSSDYSFASNIVVYWLHMWERSGKISGFTDKDGNDYSTLHKKTFANRHFAYSTLYTSEPQRWVSTPESVRQFDFISPQFMKIDAAGESRYYNVIVQEALAPTEKHKYPVVYSGNAPSVSSEITSTSAFLFTSEPVQLEFFSSPHAAVVLPSETTEETVGGEEVVSMARTVLPNLSLDSPMEWPERGADASTGEKYTGALVPWEDSSNDYVYYIKNVLPIFLPYVIRPQGLPPVTVENPCTFIVRGISIDSHSTVELLSVNYYEAGSDWLLRLEDAKQKVRAAYGETPAYVGVLVRFGYSALTYTYKTYTVPLESITAVADTSVSPTRYRITVKTDDYKVSSTGTKQDFGGGWTSYTEDTNKVSSFSNSFDNYVEDNDYSDPGSLSYEGVCRYYLETGEVQETKVYPFTDYKLNQSYFQVIQENAGNDLTRASFPSDAPYLFIGELYRDYDAMSQEDPESDTRYGGISEAAVQACRFIPAGPICRIEDLRDGDSGSKLIFGIQGDTFFQRWDCLKTKPFSETSVNNVIDITSVMVETHINLDGRTSLQRYTTDIASIDTESYSDINWAYSQPDNYSVKRVLDSDVDQSSFSTYITWTLPKTDSASVDEWTHLTLSSNLALDGDKGSCTALRNFNNQIIAFQDKCLSEILFNSRTQLSTEEGVPVEIANSGKVDGKRILSSKYGCTNKWSITEGKAGLYFVDNINKAFCAFTGQGVSSLSDKLGFAPWFRTQNKMNPWNPSDFDNFVSFYDRNHSDVYLVGKETSGGQGCLVYNEVLGVFTSFYDYGSVPMMANVQNKFISFKNGSLWRQREGFYGNFFGTDYAFWTTYRITPDPYGDKIWTNVEYRSDFYKILDDDASEEKSEADFIDGGERYVGEQTTSAGDYMKDETFDVIRVWNEYQRTWVLGEADPAPDLEKRFRIWRYTVPRAAKTETNKYGLDRIRNPWVNLMLKKTASENNRKNLMQMHDAVAIYYE